MKLKLVRRNLLSLLIVCLLLNFQIIHSLNIRKKTVSSLKAINKKEPKKNILIFTSKGGAGHTSVSNGLKSYLEDFYNISIVNIFEEVVFPADPVQYITFGKLNGEDLYNLCLQYRWISITNGFVRIGAWRTRHKKDVLEKLIYDYTSQNKPDLIISVIPLFTEALISVAKKLNIPVLVVTNDLDTTNYINGMLNPGYDKFYYTLSFDDQELWSKITPANIPKKQIRITGFPLRPEFFGQKRNKIAIKKEFKVPLNKKTVMLLMGGAGSLANYKYVRELAKSKKPIHLIVCLGKNEKLRANIENIHLPPHITISIIGFTNRIADLMYISDVLITKPGPGSICEAIAIGLPMIIDQINGTLWWEQANVDLTVKHGFGKPLTNLRNLHPILNDFLDERCNQQIKQKMFAFKSKTPFKDNITKLVKEILA